MQKTIEQPISEPSLEEAFRLSIQSVQAVSEEASRVETKIIGAFAAASAIVGISAAVSTSLVSAKLYWPNLFFYVALIAYIWVILWTYKGLRLRLFYLPPDPKILKEDYWSLPKTAFMRQVCEFAETHYEEHVENLTAKSSSLLMVLPGLLVEVLLLLLWAICRAAFPIS